MTVSVCIGSACHLKGSYEIIHKLNDLIAQNQMEDKVDIKATFCLGNCVGAVSVKVDQDVYSVQPDTVDSFFQHVIRERV